MAKTRAQRKAERRRREQAEKRGLPQRDEAELEEEGRAQEATRLGVSGEVAEAEAAIETGARVDEYGERVVIEPEEGELPSTCASGGATPSWASAAAGPIAAEQPRASRTPMSAFVVHARQRPGLSRAST